jgi:hypothetical protein
MKTFKLKFSFLLPIFLVLFFSSSLFSAATFTSGSTASELANEIEGVGISISNPTISYGGSTQVGIFSNGISGAGLEIDEGIILSTMSVSEVFTSNSIEILHRMRIY